MSALEKNKVRAPCLLCHMTKLLLTGLLLLNLGFSRSVQAQADKFYRFLNVNAAPGRADTVSEVLPQLPGGGGKAGLVTAVQRRIELPRSRPAGMVRVTFVVDVSGQVQSPAIAQGLSSQADAAVLAAVRRLPRFIPGQYNRQPAAVELTLDVPLRRLK